MLSFGKNVMMVIRVLFILGIIVSFTMTSCKSNTQTGNVNSSAERISEVEDREEIEHDSDMEIVKGELIVVFENDAEIKSVIEEIEKYEGVSFITMLMDVEDAHVAHFKVPVDEEKTYIRLFSKNKGIQYAEPNMKGSFLDAIEK